VLVDIDVLDVAGEQRHGEFRINLAAGVDDSLIGVAANPAAAPHSPTAGGVGAIVHHVEDRVLLTRQ
jgi:hypothetical protein